jgi:putative addiction module killer protein
MITFVRTERFIEWFRALPDVKARARIAARITQAEQGNFGDCAPVGGGVSEMRIHHGPGYRVYYAHHGDRVVLLLCGGDKSAQQHDIDKAHRLADQWRMDIKEARDERQE